MRGRWGELPVPKNRFCQFDSAPVGHALSLVSTFPNQPKRISNLLSAGSWNSSSHGYLHNPKSEIKFNHSRPTSHPPVFQFRCRTDDRPRVGVSHFIKTAQSPQMSTKSFNKKIGFSAIGRPTDCEVVSNDSRQKSKFCRKLAEFICTESLIRLLSDRVDFLKIKNFF